MMLLRDPNVEYDIWDYTHEWQSKRLGDTFLDLLAYRRWKYLTTGSGRTMDHPCQECGKEGTTIYCITFGAAFCCPGCYIKFNNTYLAWCEEAYREREESDANTFTSVEEMG